MKINKLELWKYLLDYTIDEESFEQSALIRDHIKNMDPDEEYDVDEFTEYAFKIESGEIYITHRNNEKGDDEFLQDDVDEDDV